MSPQRRQQLLLGALALVLVVALWLRVGPLLTSGGGSGFAAGGRASDSVAVQDGEILELAALSPEVRTYQVKRDPFRFGELPPPPRPPAQPRTPPPRPVEPTPVPQQVNTGPVLPSLELTYLGRFGTKRRPIATLTDGETIINAREGDPVNDDFRVKSINLESIDLEYIHFPDQPAQRLPIGS